MRSLVAFVTGTLALVACSVQATHVEPDSGTPPAKADPVVLDECNAERWLGWCAQDNHLTEARWAFETGKCAEPGAPYYLVDGKPVFRPGGFTGCTPFSQSNITCCR